jgi:hypothetical protein
MRPAAKVSLNVIRVATPCPVDWNTMHGDARVRPPSVASSFFLCVLCVLHASRSSDLGDPFLRYYV